MELLWPVVLWRVVLSCVMRCCEAFWCWGRGYLCNASLNKFYFTRSSVGVVANWTLYPLFHVSHITDYVIYESVSMLQVYCASFTAVPFARRPQATTWLW